jgi:phenylalanine-4-hydroxylase
MNNYFDKIILNQEKTNLIFDELPINLFGKKVNEIWTILFRERQKMISLHANIMPVNYKSYLNQLGYIDQIVPNLSQINKAILPNNWKCIWANKISEDDFFLLVSEKIFPITTYCRKIDEIERSVYPDFIHDLWGHIPLLLWKELSDVIVAIAKEIILHEYNSVDKEINHEISLRAKAYYNKINFDMSSMNLDSEKNISVKKLLSRLFLFTVEFGLQKKNDAFSILGGGILSSSKEIRNVLESKAPKLELSLSTIYANEYCLHDKQSCYLYVNCIDDIYSILEEIKNLGV